MAAQEANLRVPARQTEPQVQPRVQRKNGIRSRSLEARSRASAKKQLGNDADSPVPRKALEHLGFSWREVSRHHNHPKITYGDVGGGIRVGDVHDRLARFGIDLETGGLESYSNAAHALMWIGILVKPRVNAE